MTADDGVDAPERSNSPIDPATEQGLPAGSVRLTSGAAAGFGDNLEEPAVVPGEAALLAEPALAENWSRPEEEAGWSHLQPGMASVGDF